jgi:hypothetical protein
VLEEHLSALEPRQPDVRAVMRRETGRGGDTRARLQSKLEKRASGGGAGGGAAAS